MTITLKHIAGKVEARERLSLDEGLALFHSPDLWEVCRLAQRVRERLHGRRAFYNINRHVNYTNICALSCKFCSFYRKKDDDGAYEFDVNAIREEAIRAQEAGATEIHIVGGLHPWLPFSYYTDMLRAIRESAPRLHIKAFTAVEIVHLARIARRANDIAGVLRDLRDAGLGSLPGGGAEVFDDRVHDEAFKGKIRSDKWLEVHREAHRLGMNTNATILYGHIESLEDRLHHMDLLRLEQDRALEAVSSPDAQAWPSLGVGSNGAAPRPLTGIFQTIIPLPFIPDESELEHLPGPSGVENLRMLAVCRLMLDNFAHVKAFWIMQTLEMAELMLQAGADDLDGTVVWYDITRVGGAGTHQETDVNRLRRAIRDAGFEPIERDTLYRPITRDGAAWEVREAGVASDVEAHVH